MDKIIRMHCENTGTDYDQFDFSGAVNLIDTGIYDSLGFLQLIAILEEETGKEIDLSDYDPETFTEYHTLLKIISD